jgi:hypothetical protein
MRDLPVCDRLVNVWSTRVGIVVSRDAWLLGIESGRRSGAGTPA